MTGANKRRVSDGSLVVGCGLLHTLVGAVLAWPDMIAVARDGFLDAVYGVHATGLSRGYGDWIKGFAHVGDSRPLTFWFLWTGFAWIILGALCHWVERAAGLRLPRWVGASLLVYGLSGFVLVPLSGFPILIATSLVLLHRSRSRVGEPG
jgi:hypothetical protein